MKFSNIFVSLILVMSLASLAFAAGSCTFELFGWCIMPGAATPSLVKAPASNCTDTDGGMSYYLQGTTANGSGTATDYCAGSTTVLNEYYCNGNAIAYTTYTCPIACSGGACTNQTNLTLCTDSDGGAVFNVQGTATGMIGGATESLTDFCNGNVLVEYYCGYNLYDVLNTTYDCTANNYTGCQNGMCILNKTVTPNNGGLQPANISNFSVANITPIHIPSSLILNSPQSYNAVPVAFTPVRDTYSISTSGTDCIHTVTYTNARWIQVSTPGCALFGGASNLIPQMVSTFYFDPIGLSVDSYGNVYPANYSDGTGLTSTNSPTEFNSVSSWAPKVFYQVPGQTCYHWADATYNSASSFVKFDTVGSSSAAQGEFYFANNQNSANLLGASTGSYQAAVIFQEDAGKVNATTNNAVKLAAPFVVFDSQNTVTDTSTYKFLPASSTQTKTYYEGLSVGAYATAQALDIPFITERGTQVTSVSSTAIVYEVAAEIAQPKFYFYGSNTVNEYAFNTLITDTLDKVLQNRITDTASETYVNSLSADDTGATPLSPVRGSTYISNSIGARLYRIGGTEFSEFADYATSDSQASGFNYTEQQNFWIGTGNSNSVAFDPNDKEVEINKYDLAAYNSKFLGNDFGIPVCTGDLNVSDNWASCNCSSNSMTYSHRVSVKFLGSDWIISYMEAPTASLASSVAAVNGGTAKLAKESAYGILDPGNFLSGGVLKALLYNVSSVAGSCGNAALFNILDINDVVVGQVSIDPGQTYTFTQSGTGDTIKIHVYKTASGSKNLSATWAETAIYSEEITLQDGSRYNLVSSSDANKDFFVSLLWKNRDYTGSGTSTQPDSLREIAVYQYQNFVKAVPGSVYNFLASGTTFHLQYAGIAAVAGDCSGNKTGTTALDQTNRSASVLVQVDITNASVANPCAAMKCAYGYTCTNGACVANQGDSCAVIHCASGYVCNSGLCVAGQSTDPCDSTKCTSGYVCSNGACISSDNVVGRLSYWWGKVNQHNEGGMGEKWATDPDGVSGANLDLFAYCQKWFPKTTSVQMTSSEIISGWKNRGNLLDFTSTKPAYLCIGGATTPTDPCASIKCMSGYTCSNGACVENAPTDSCASIKCASGYTCTNGECISKCAAVKCASGYSCVDGACVESQTLDPCAAIKCASGYTCSDGECIATVPSGSGSTPTDPCASIKCASGYACTGGTCVENAPADSCASIKCASGYTCSDGACVKSAAISTANASSLTATNATLNKTATRSITGTNAIFDSVGGLYAGILSFFTVR